MLYATSNDTTFCGGRIALANYLKENAKPIVKDKLSKIHNIYDYCQPSEILSYEEKGIIHYYCTDKDNTDTCKNIVGHWIIASINTNKMWQMTYYDGAEGISYIEPELIKGEEQYNMCRMQ